MMNRTLMVTGLALALAGTAFAHDGDAGIRANASGRLETFLVETEPSSGNEPIERVFASEIGTIEFGPFGNDEPGYYTDSLTEGTSIGFNIRGELMRWNGGGLDGGLAETLQFAKFLGTPGEISRTTGPGFVPGFDFATVSGGVFDEHLSHILLGSGGDPADGVYIIELELTSASHLTSDPYWIVFNLNRPESEHDEAIEWVVANLVPAPGATAFFAAAMALGLRRRR